MSLVFLGGATGTLARWAVGLAVPHLDRVPLGTFVVNVVGAFVLGALTAGLARRGPDQGRRRALRLTVGTGLDRKSTRLNSSHLVSRMPSSA